MNLDSQETPEVSIRRAVRRAKALSLAFLVVVGLTVLLFYRTDLGANALHHLDMHLRVGPLVLAFALISLAFVFMALRWRALMPPGHSPPALGLSAMICTGLLFNYTVPGPAGELGAAWFAHRRYKVPLADSLASGISARLVGLATAGLLAGLAWTLGDLVIDPELAAHPLISEHVQPERLQALAMAMVAVGVLAVIFIFRPYWWANFCSILIRPLRGESMVGRIAGKADHFILDLGRSVNAVRTRGLRPMAAAGFWALCGHTTVIAGITIAASSLGAEPSLTGVVFTYATATSLSMALFAFPGSQLGWDLLFGGLLMLTASLGDLSLIDQPEQYLATMEGTAAAIVLLVRVQQLSFMLLGAAVVGWMVKHELISEPEPSE